MRKTPAHTWPLTVSGLALQLMFISNSFPIHCSAFWILKSKQLWQSKQLWPHSTANSFTLPPYKVVHRIRLFLCMFSVFLSWAFWWCLSCNRISTSLLASFFFFFLPNFYINITLAIYWDSFNNTPDQNIPEVNRLIGNRWKGVSSISHSQASLG